MAGGASTGWRCFDRRSSTGTGGLEVLRTTGGGPTVTFANTATTAGKPGAPGTSTAGGAPAQHPQAVTFALNPGTAVGNTILDYINNKAHNKLYLETIKSLYSDPKNKFDMLSDQIQTLLNLTSIRLQMVCNIILMLFGRNLCECHAQHTLADMRSQSLTYMGTPTRLAQDDSSFAQMLWNSISDNAVTVMSLRAADFTVNGMTSASFCLRVCSSTARSMQPMIRC